MKNKEQGFIGLVMLLLGVGLLVFFIVRTDLFSSNKEDKNIVEISTDVLDEARSVKVLVEENNRNRVEN